MSGSTTDCVIGLGSNLGDRAEILRWAVVELGALGEAVAISALYETEPVGPPQPAYLNAAVRLVTPLDLPRLLDQLLAIERRAGRERRERWGARILDLDILWASSGVFESETLKVPHPRLNERAFALLPLLDVVPDAIDPRSGEPYARVLERCTRAGAQELARLWTQV
jgi:2-amino-4-hydroxy-6-hydroxymethyldihydropteridine diphosphokinase